MDAKFRQLSSESKNSYLDNIPCLGEYGNCLISNLSSLSHFEQHLLLSCSHTEVITHEFNQSLICFISKLTALNTRSHFSCFQLSGIQHDHQTSLDRIGKSHFSPFDCCCCIARPHEQITFFASYPLFLAEEFTREHDQSLWRCLRRILGVGDFECQDSARSAATLPLALGGLGLRSALRTRSSAFWASWADCLPMVFKRYPDLVADFVDELEGPRS